MIIWRARSLAALLSLLVAMTVFTPIDASADVHAGQRLSEALLELNTHDANIMFSTRLVDGNMRVRNPPTAGDPLDIAREILAPYKLTLVAGPANRWIVATIKNDPRAADFTITGRIISENSGSPVQGAKVSSGETAVTTDTSGFFFDSGVATRRDRSCCG